MKFETRALEPFGLEVRVPDGTRWEDVSPDDVHAWVAAHRVVVIRGLAPFTKEDLPRVARRLGPLQPWEFGAVNELVPDDAAKNYLYTRRAVPLHWDGAFAKKVPRYLFFQCVEAPDEDAGGETVFVDAARPWREADGATRDRWRSLRFTYETERVVHYGGRFTARAVGQHPHTHETVLRFAEPVDDLNPVYVQAEGLSPLESAAEVTDLRRRLADPAGRYEHRWRTGDVVVADNHALLHGRNAFARASSRHLRRVNVHSPGRDWAQPLEDSLRIRRPEFMVAEVPILLVPALWVTRGGELGTWFFAEVALLFFLLFHFGDMVNCLADRDLDAVYKTRLSEAVYGLGVDNVAWQIALTALAAVALSVHVSSVTGRWEAALLTVLGLALGWQYSYGPVRSKSRGLLQVATLWAVIFLGPMLLVTAALAPAMPRELLALAAAYGAMQQGVILANTAEDLPEDAAAGIRTAAVALGLPRCLALAALMVALGGAVVLAIVGRELVVVGRVVAGLPLLAGWAWAMTSLLGAWRAVRGRALDEAVKALRPRSRLVPVWIAATAWGTLAAVWAARR